MKEYSIMCGRRDVGNIAALSPYEALREFLGRRGARREEITTLGPDKLSWLGAVYTAVPVA